MDFLKTKLKSILTLNQTELNEKTKVVYESINNRLDELVKEDTTFKDKADVVRKQIQEMDLNRYNLYRMEDLLESLS